VREGERIDAGATATASMGFFCGIEAVGESEARAAPAAPFDGLNFAMSDPIA
jgi:hypothetical protein